jgi:ABC-type xylose transport system permease subunit
MPPWVTNISPYTAAVSIGIAISLLVVDKFPEHSGEVRAVAWVVAGAAIGTAIAPGVGTVVGALVGGLVAWATS